MYSLKNSAIDLALKLIVALSGIYFTTLGGVMSFFPPLGATTWAHEKNNMLMSRLADMLMKFLVIYFEFNLYIVYFLINTLVYFLISTSANQLID